MSIKLMNRIFITGNAGAAKTTLSQRLGDILELPVTSLDKIVWQPKWLVTPVNEQRKLIADLVKPEIWIIDGVSKEILRLADTIIFLDFPRRISYWRLCKRNWRYLFRSRPELPNNCPEILIIKKLITIVWRFHKHVRPNILKFIHEQYDKKIIFHVRSNKDLKNILEIATQQKDYKSKITI